MQCLLSAGALGLPTLLSARHVRQQHVRQRSGRRPGNKARGIAYSAAGGTRAAPGGAARKPLCEGSVQPHKAGFVAITKVKQ